jgi:phosphate transport system substrate-binding protein
MTTSPLRDVTGAGATFPAPVYAKWADAYNKATGVRINYQSVGSGAGIKQIKAKTVDFGASDMPLKDDDLAKDGLLQFPTVIGGVVPVVNIKGIAPGQIKLTGQVLGDIYLGKITKWNDAAIDGAEPRRAAARRRHRGGAPRRRFGHQLHLHQLPEQGERRVEGQGGRGHGRQLAGGRGRQGQRRRGRLRAAPAQLDRLCRVRLRQAEQDDLTLMKNKDGNFVSPDDDTAFKAAAAGADWNKSFYQIPPSSRARTPGRSPAPPSS